MAHRRHAIDYIELPAPDVAAVKRFYGAAFGWEFTDYGPGYAGIKGADGEEVGGLNGAAAPQSAPSGPLVLLWSEDLEASLAAVEQAGGQVVQPILSFPGGRRFHFADPAGNHLGVWGAS